MSYIKLMTALALLSLIGLGLASTNYAYGWARTDFDKNNNQFYDQGYHLIEVNAYVSPGATDAAWNGVWSNAREVTQFAYGWARADFDKNNKKLYDQGFHLKEINAYVPPGATDAAWNGIWVKNNDVTQFAYGWARADFDKNNKQLYDQGFHLTEVNAYVPPGATDAVWNGIWVKNNDVTQFAYGWARADFDKNNKQLYDQGFHLKEINAYVPPGATDAVWNGIWIKNNDVTQFAYGWARGDFNKNNKDLQSKGYLLIEVNAYVPPGATDAIWNGIWKKS